MGPATATSLRRAWFAACAPAVTVGAHALTSDAVRLTRAAPLMWAAMFAGVFALGTRAPVRQFRPWRASHIVALLVGTQFAAHILLGAAPSAIGLTMSVDHHHHGGAAMMIDGRSLVVHLVAALIIGLLLRGAQRRLMGLVRVVVHLVRHAFAHRTTPAVHPWTRLTDHIVSTVRLIQDCLSSRGPPESVSA